MSGEPSIHGEKQGWTARFTALAHTPAIIPALLLLEILETSFVPLPYEAVFIAVCLAARDRIWLFTAITVLGSAIAGSILYAVGAGLAEPLAAQFGVEATVATYQDAFNERGGLLILLGGLTPVPSYAVNLAAGASSYPFWPFVGLFSLSRFIRFALLGLALYLFGDAITRGWERLPKWPRRIAVVALLIIVTWWALSGLAEAPT
ncbi:MAG: VTT domain-containing protein [Pseudomonadota bacterium]